MRTYLEEGESSWRNGTHIQRYTLGSEEGCFLAVLVKDLLNTRLNVVIGYGHRMVAAIITITSHPRASEVESTADLSVNPRELHLISALRKLVHYIGIWSASVSNDVTIEWQDMGHDACVCTTICTTSHEIRGRASAVDWSAHPMLASTQTRVAWHMQTCA
jgi:hypothetical protein